MRFERERRGSKERGFGGPREMFPAKCADCGVETQVPFKPAPDRPVYCQECYKKHRPPRRRF